MQTKVGHLFGIVVYAMALSSCINNVPVGEPQKEIVFKAAVDYPEDLPFRVWAYDLPGDMTWEEDCRFASESIHGEESRFERGYWRTKNPHFWPQDGRTSNFFACSPADAPVTFNCEDGIIMREFNVADHGDFLVALPVENIANPDNDGAVNLIFYDPLCELRFRAFASVDEGVEINITRIDLKQTYTQGDYHSLPQPKWTSLDLPQDQVLFDGFQKLSERPVDIVSAHRIIPQDLTLQVYYSYKDDASPEYKEDNMIVCLEGNMMRPMPGVSRTYTLKLTQKSVEILTPR